MARHIVPDVVSKQDLSSLSPKDTVLAAAKLMTSRKIEHFSSSRERSWSAFFRNGISRAVWWLRKSLRGRP